MTGVAEPVVSSADRALAEHPLFGDSARILDKVLARYRFGLELFAERLPSLRTCTPSFAALDAATARRTCFDPLVRLALEAAFSDLEAGRLAPPHRIEEVLPQALKVLPLGLCQSHMASRWSIAGDPPKWLWDLRDGADPHQSSLRAAFERIFVSDARNAGVLLTPDASARSRIDEASALLGTLLPRAGASALRHVEAIALLSARLEGGTVLSAAGGDLTPSTIFLSLDELGNSWDIAGCLLHEGLHLKLFDATRAVALASDPGETVQVPWRNVRWSIVRALFAHHVYVHLSLFKAAALGADRSCLERFGDPRTFVTRPHAMSVSQNQSGTGFGRSIDRARYLGEKLEGDWSRLLTDEGRDLVCWLNRALAPVDRAVFSQPAAAAGPARGRLRKVASLRSHPVPQAECLMVFGPTPGRLQYLDLNAWLILELLENRTLDEIELLYLEVVGDRLPDAQARQQVRSTVEALLRNHLIEDIQQPDRKETPHEQSTKHPGDGQGARLSPTGAVASDSDLRIE